MSDRQRRLLDRLIFEHDIELFLAWYITPMALSFTRQLAPVVTVFDCMDELSAFKGAPRNLIEQEPSAWTHELDLRPDRESF